MKCFLFIITLTNEEVDLFYTYNHTYMHVCMYVCMHVCIYTLHKIHVIHECLSIYDIYKKNLEHKAYCMVLSPLYIKPGNNCADR